MSKQSPLFRTLVGAALISCVAGVAQAQEPSKKPPNTQLPSQIIPTGAEDAPQAANAAAARSARAAGPSAEQLESELVRMTSESSAGLVAVNLPNGSRRVDLDGRFMSVAVATPTADGSVDVSCLTGQEAVDKVKYARQVSAGALPKPKKSSHAEAHKASTAQPEEK
jgi:hypothetical protein